MLSKLNFRKKLKEYGAEAEEENARIYVECQFG